MVVLEHRRHQAGLVARVGVGTVPSLHDPPPVVLAPGASRRLKVDLLVLILAYIGNVEVAGATVERETPGVAEAERPDLAPVPGASRKRVGGRDRVRRCPGLDIDPQDLAQKGGWALRIVLGVAGGAAVAHPDGQGAVGAAR